MAVKRAGKDKMVKGAPREKNGTLAVDKAAREEAAKLEAERVAAEEAEREKAEREAEREKAEAERQRVRMALASRYKRSFPIAGDGPALAGDKIGEREGAWE